MCQTDQTDSTGTCHQYYTANVPTACALVLALLTLRMSGHYLPLATIAWGLSLYYLMGNLDALGKYDGMRGSRV